MIEAFFHTQLMLQKALEADGVGDDVFLSRGAVRADDSQQWYLSPGPVDLGEGTALVLPASLSRTRSLGIGAADANPFEADVYGTVPVLVTVTAVLGVSGDADWFDGKKASARIAEIARGIYPGDFEPEQLLTEADIEAACNLSPSDYGVGGKLRNTALWAIRPLRGESFVAAAEDDVFIWWRTFLLSVRVE